MLPQLVLDFLVLRQMRAIESFHGIEVHIVQLYLVPFNVVVSKIAAVTTNSGLG